MKTNKRSHKTGPRGSRYPSSPGSPDEYSADQARWRAVKDLMDAFREGVADLKFPVTYGVNSSDLSIGASMMARLRDEAERVTTDTKEHEAIIRYSIPYVQWAETHTPMQNPSILARFAVEMAFDAIYRIKLSYTLSYTWPTRWHWQNDQSGGRNASQQFFYPDTTDYKPPIAFWNQDKLIAKTAQYGGEILRPVNILESFCGLTKPSYLWAFDSIRPPIQAVRAAAALIKQHPDDHSSPIQDRLFGYTPKNVLFLEPGHSIAAQALSIFLPREYIYTSSLIYKGTTHPGRPDKFDAIVLNISNGATMAFTQMILNRHNSEPVWPLNRWDVGKFWDWPRNDPGNHADFLMAIALGQLAEDGVLIILGDIESGQLHKASQIIRMDDTMEPITIGGNAKPIMFQYKTPTVWGLYGSLPPTGRLMGAWKRAQSWH